MATNIGDFGNGVGLLYITQNDGTSFINPGLVNDSFGAGEIKSDALNRAPIPSSVRAKGSFEFTTLAFNDNIFSFTINGIAQITNPVAVLAGQEEAAAVLLAAEINTTTPVSGVKYEAVAIGKKVLLLAPPSAGDTVNGHLVVPNIPVAGNTFTTDNVDGGSNGSEVFSEVNGARYFMHSDASAVLGDISSPDVLEITDYVIMRGVQSQHIVQKQTISSKSITDLPRYDRFSVLELGAGANTDLDVIEGNFAKNDILILQNTSAFTITVNDLSVNQGNIKIDPISFGMVNDDYIIWLQYQEDATDGLVWREIYRKPTTLATDSVTDVELANLSVGTPELKDTSVTTAKIALASITAALMSSNSVDTANIIDDAITTVKILNDAITTDKIINDAVTEDKILAGAVTTDKIASGAVTLDKVSSELKQDSMVVPVSWETGEQGLTKVKMPACTVTDIFVSITKDIAGSDDATLIPKDHSGTIMTDGTIDLPAGAPLGNDDSSAPSGNATFTNGEQMGLETLKTTPGGKANVTITYIKS